MDCGINTILFLFHIRILISEATLKVNLLVEWITPLKLQEKWILIQCVSVQRESNQICFIQ